MTEEAPGPPSGAPTAYSELLRNHRFLAFFSSYLLGETGYAVYSVAIPWLAYTTTHQVTVVGAVVGLEFGVYALAFLAGPYIDRVANLRTVLVIGYPLQAAGAAALGFAAEAGVLTIPLLLGLVALISVVWDFTWTASNAVPPEIVGASTLFRANGVINAGAGGGQIAGYAAGSALLFLAGPSYAAFLYAGLNVAAGIAALGVDVPRIVRAIRSVGEEFRAGWRYLFGGSGRPLLQLSLYSAFQSFFTAAPAILLPVLASEKFAVPAGAYGVMFTAFAIGGGLGVLVLGQMNPRRWLGLVLGFGPIAEGLLLVGAIYAAPQLLASALGWFAVGAVDGIFFATWLVYLQATAPPQLVARTITNSYVFRGSSRAVGAVAIGFLVAAVSLAWVGATIGVFMVLVGAVGMLALPVIRRLHF
ncbi:MAG: MFS transporter [Thermoplasmata archaeon]